MTTFLYQHSAFANHEPGIQHPESPSRLNSVMNKLDEACFENLVRFDSPMIQVEVISLMHDPNYIDTMISY